jgi:glycosyltransferase involved in cell wall biosynthesis
MRVAKLVRYLPGLGWDVTVVCSDEARPEINDVELADEIPSEVRVRRVRGPFRRLGGGATRAVTSAWRAGRSRRLLGAVTAVARSVLLPDRWIGWAAAVARLPVDAVGQPSVIVSSGPPHSVHLAGARLASRLGVPLVMDLRDEWAGNPFMSTVAPWQSWANRRLEAMCLKQATRVVVVSPLMRDALVMRVPGIAGRVSVIRNGFDPDDLIELPARVAADPARSVTLLYAGRLLNRQESGRFFEALGEIAQRAPGSICLELLGQIDPDQVAAATTFLGTAGLNVRPPTSHREALAAMARADILVVFTGGGGAGAGTMTGKLYEYLALRRPVVLIGPAGDAADLVLASGAGVVAWPDDLDGINRSLEAAIAMARDPTFAGATDAFLEPYDRRRLAEAWSVELKRATENPQQ